MKAKFFLSVVILGLFLSCKTVEKKFVLFKQPFPLKNVSSDFLDFYENYVFQIEMFPENRDLYIQQALKRVNEIEDKRLKGIGKGILNFYRDDFSKALLLFDRNRLGVRNKTMLYLIDYYRGRIFLDTQRVDEARNIFSSLLKKGVRYYGNFYYLIVSFIKSGDYEKAENLTLWFSREFPFMRGESIRLLDFISIAKKERGINKVVFGDFFTIPFSYYSVKRLLKALYNKDFSNIPNKYYWVSNREFFDILATYGRFPVCNRNVVIRDVKRGGKIYNLVCFLISKGFIENPLTGKIGLYKKVSHIFGIKLLFFLKKAGVSF